MPDYASFPSLVDRGVLVTGGGSGIGASLVTHFAAQGARVAFIDIAAKASRALAAELEGVHRHSPLYLECDITDTEALAASIDAAEQALGGVSVLVNNAGNDERHAVESVTPQMWDERMIAAADAADLRLMVSHNLLFYEPHRVVRDLIASGDIRRPHLFRTRLTCGNMYGSWRDRADLCGGGLLIDSGAHRFYTARQMMGEVKSVTAWLDTDDPRRRGDETGFVVMEFEQGGVGLIDSTFHAPGETFDDLIELVSRDAMIWIPGSEAEYLKTWSHPPLASGAEVMICRDGTKWEVLSTPTDDWASSCVKSVAHFADCIRGRAEPITSGHEGRRNLAVLEAAYLSGMERRPVSVSEVG